MPRSAHRVLLLVGSFLLSACTIELQHDLTEDDANEIYVLLQNNAISADKVKEEGGNEPRYIITVPKQNIARAAQLLKENSLPRPKADGLAVFKKMKGMIPTQTEERAMFIEAVAGEISNALNQYPGVLEARTILMIPEVNDLTQPEKRPMPSASVFIKYKPAESGKTPFDLDQVTQFVANSVTDLKKENVRLLLAEAKELPQSGDPSLQPDMVIGLRFMDKGSANSFRMMVAVNAVLFLALAGVAAFLVIRKPGTQRPSRKTQPSDA